MALYKIIRIEQDITERSYFVDGDTEDHALGNYNGNQWDKIHPQEMKHYKETIIKIQLEL